jgi:hypothetical protein
MTEHDCMPVQLLRDRRGIYGIGVSDLFDYEAIAWSCGVEPKPYTFESPSALILRPDCFMKTKSYVGERMQFARDSAVLQKIVGGFRGGPFMRSGEERLRQFIHHEALKRAGFAQGPLPAMTIKRLSPSDAFDPEAIAPKNQEQPKSSDFVQVPADACSAVPHENPEARWGAAMQDLIGGVSIK